MNLYEEEYYAIMVTVITLPAMKWKHKHAIF